MENVSNDNYRSGAPKLIGGLYPKAVLTDEFFDALERARTAPELEHLTPAGFFPLASFELERFDIPRVAEIYETALNFFVQTLAIDRKASLTNVQSLCQLLLCRPGCNNAQGVFPGEVMLALWVAGVEFQLADYFKGGAAFALDYEKMMDAESYKKSGVGFEHIMNPISGKKYIEIVIN